MIKRTIFSLLILILSLELISYSYLNFLFQESKQIKTLEKKVNNDNGWVFSPYYGFELQGKRKFPYDYKKHEGEYVIGVLGGSVANYFSESYGYKEFERLLIEKIPDATKITLIPLCYGGFKQPMQLFQFQFSLLAGLDYDMVISIDGYNEAVFTYQNIEMNVNPIFPGFNHLSFVSEQFYNDFDIKDAEYLIDRNKLVNNIKYLEKFNLRYPNFIKLVILKINNYYKNRLNIITNEHNNIAIKKLDSKHTGSNLLENTIESPSEYSANLWAKSARLVNAICEKNKTPYFHFVQPNQYVPNSKIFTEFEIENCYKPESYQSQRILEIYPLIQTTCKDLKKEFPVYDLTNIFKETKETVYIDDCCHFYELGNEIMANAIADSIISYSEHEKIF